MAQLTFLAILPFVLPALGANLQARNNWGSGATTTVIASSVAATPAIPSIGIPISSIAATPVFPSNDAPTSTVVATPVPTSYFSCGGSNFTVTASSSYIGQPTGVTTVTFSLPNSGIASSSAASGPVTVTASSRLAARNNWPTNGPVISSIAAPIAIPSSSPYPGDIATVTGSVSFPGGTATETGSVSFPGGTATGTGSVSECPYPTSTVYASGPVSSLASSSGALTASGPRFPAWATTCWQR
ncbi:hypothetical protein BKA70DRAFT_651451 [Coprinopsis sp. MPI-PUGE-AT-0042]|nr:hypothetical protein BKA70DRAFT_651451 [Coprinopsis sp. MPI-PUGE-AT-0042]